MDERVKQLVERCIAGENELLKRSFLAPVVTGGRVCARVDALLYTFRIESEFFEGWGILTPEDRYRVRLEREAALPQVERYLSALKALRLLTVRPLDGSAWLAYPAGESDMYQRTGRAGPVTVRFVEGADRFDGIAARFDGRNCWFEETDRCADPRHAEYLRTSLAAGRPAAELRCSGLTPEHRTAYDLAVAEILPGARSPHAGTLEEQRRRTYALLEAAHRRAVGRLPREALAWAGGRLSDVRERGDAWLIRWRTSNGGTYTSMVRKNDLSVVSAGICLDGRDRDFDLHSLVSVMEEFERDGFSH